MKICFVIIGIKSTLVQVPSSHYSWIQLNGVPDYRLQAEREYPIRWTWSG